MTATAVRTPHAFDAGVALDALLADVGLSSKDAGGAVDFSGHDPILASPHRLGACIGLPIMGAAVAAAALHRHRTGQGQDLHLDLRRAAHQITPDAYWSPTLNGLPAPRPLVRDNPFLLEPYRCRDGRMIMACGVYPHQVAAWCRLLDVPPDPTRVADAISRRDSAELEDAAAAVGLPATVVRTPEQWRAHPQGALLAASPVIELERIADGAPVPLPPAARPLDGVRVLSFTHAIAGPTVGRTLAEHGADVLCATRPDDFEHDFIYDEANLGSRSTYLDLTTPDGRARAQALLAEADVVVDNHRPGKLAQLGLEPRHVAGLGGGTVVVSVSCYGTSGPWGERGGFDMNGSAASGLMTIEGGEAAPTLPPTGMINDFVTGYLGAIGATAGLLKRAVEGGSWHVRVGLTRAAMWYQELGLVDPSLAGVDDEHRLRDPEPYDADSPLGPVHVLAPPVEFSHTPPAWPDPPLVPRGSSPAAWLPRPKENRA